MGFGHSVIRLFTVAVLLALAACGGGPSPTMVQLTLTATPDVNAIQNVPSPVLVRVYQLASPAGFGEADYFQLDKDAAGVLGGNMLGKDEYFLSPGGSQTVLLEMAPDARFVGVVAAYYDIDNATWRGTAPVEPGKSNKITATVGALAVSLQAGS
ncbi:MAG: type VI secretion system lipoprotein TssJ [Inquilinus sp.]|nr:type VI secretion system lipoprotein TssJ [Inquilinus sp.]